MYNLKLSFTCWCRMIEKKVLGTIHTSVREWKRKKENVASVTNDRWNRLLKQKLCTQFQNWIKSIKALSEFKSQFHHVFAIRYANIYIQFMNRSATAQQPLIQLKVIKSACCCQLLCITMHFINFDSFSLNIDCPCFVFHWLPFGIELLIEYQLRSLPTSQHDVDDTNHTRQLKTEWNQNICHMLLLRRRSIQFDSIQK